MPFAVHSGSPTSALRVANSVMGDPWVKATTEGKGATHATVKPGTLGAFETWAFVE